MAFIFNFEIVTNHGKINPNGVIYTKIEDWRLERYTTVLLMISNGIVVEQQTTTRGEFKSIDFIGMTLLELTEWSASSDDDEFECRMIDCNKRNNNKQLELGG